MEVLVAPLIIFLVVVAPIWITSHYKSVNRSQSQLSKDDLHRMEQLLERFDKMAERIETLEAILDQEHGKWRDHEKNAKGS